MRPKLKAEEINAEEFEKDDAANGHMQFIHSTANIRATNYKIKNCDRPTSQKIAGDIIPALATTTTMIEGMVAAEMIKVIQGYTSRDDLRNAFVNLAGPSMQLIMPSSPTIIKDAEDDLGEMVRVVPGEYTGYDKIVIDNGPQTGNQLREFLEKEYNIEISNIFVMHNGDWVGIF